ncbi:hypothetical protein EVAR_82524_1 [Eumeta japonica]|uniref:Uncharacterized protein n=1 Tax=Eumeta variegata TaxID=151549 RepID=A0A4C1UXW2_EUMVA|nr:hypothetical protein EVAR_82524_1 [Eumeta japonica]
MSVYFCTSCDTKAVVDTVDKRMVSTTAPLVLAGVMPTDLEFICASKRQRQRKNKTEAERIIPLFPGDIGSTSGRLGRSEPSNFPDPDAVWLFLKRLSELRLCEESIYACGMAYEDMHHVVWDSSLYDDLRKRFLDGLEILVCETVFSKQFLVHVGPVHYMELVGSRMNFGRLKEFAHGWHGLRRDYY